jgi:PAS domain S-box-containing protein
VSSTSADDILPGGGETGALIRQHFWSASPLGAIARWPQSLRTVVGILLSSRYQMWMGWGRELSFLYNDAYAPTLGVKHPWAIGRPAREVWAEIWPDIGPRIETVLRTGEATWDEGLLLFLERSGYPEETYHTFSYSPLRDDSGAIAGMFCVVMEETERIIGERRLSTLRDLASQLAGESEEQNVLAAVERALGANARDLPFTLTYLFDDDGGGRLAATTGIAPGHAAAPPTLAADAALSSWPARAIHARAETMLLDDLQARFPELPTGAWDRPPSAALLVPIARQGQERPAGFLVAGINPHRRHDAGYGDFVGLIAGQIASSLANARAYEAERRRAAALAEIDRAKTAFFSNVSHEFRTPLTLMLAPLEDLLNRTSDAGATDERSLVQVAHRNALRLLKLVNSLLDFARSEAGRAEASFVPTDLASLTADLAANFQAATDRAGLTLDVTCPPLPEPVLVDRDMWEKIVLNLLSNAFKFTFEGGIAVSLLPAPDGRAAELTVRDTGTGIPAAELPRLFERFHRIEGARGRTFEGSGIGLALVQELVRLHGGGIDVASEPGRGSTFTVRIPFGEAHLPADRVRAAPGLASTAVRVDAFIEEALLWLGDTPEPGSAGVPELHVDGALVRVDAAAPPARRERILLADDNADMRGYVSRLLSPHYEVEAVDDGNAALQAARRKRPDLILSDVMMPVLDGIGLLRDIRADPMLRDLPVILLSARAGEDARLEGLQSGADDYLAKPFSTRELVVRVAANLTLARVRREATERLELALEAGDLGTFTIDAVTGAGRVSARTARILGMPLDQRTTTPEERLEMVHPDDRERFRAARDSALGGDGPFREEYRMLRPDGSVRWARVEAFLQRGIDGKPRQLTGVVRDITDLRAAQEAQREHNAVLEQRVEQRTRERDRIWHLSRDLLLVLTFDGKVVAMSPSWTTGLGWREDDLLGRGISDLVHPDDREGTEARRRRLTRGEQVASFENRYRRTDGSYCWFAWTSVAGDNLIYSVGRDVTEERAAAEQLAAANRQLLAQIEEREQVEATLRQMQRLEAVGQLTSGVAHDFNNLLTVILGNLEFLRKPPVAPGQARRLEMMLQAAERGAKLTAQLLAFSRRQRLEPRPVNLNDVVSGMLDLLRSTLGGTIRLETSLQPDQASAQADQTQLELVILNLAINARDAMPGGGTLRLETGTASIAGTAPRRPEEPASGDYVTIAVADNGTGMSPEVLAKAFEPFFTTKEIGKGSGLGLPQVFGFAKQSGGGVRIDSQPGHGTTVTVFLPHAAGETAAAAAPGAADPAAAPPERTLLLLVA